MIQCVVFNVRLGQCIAFIPVDNLDYMMFVDCGHDGDFHPIDYLINNLPNIPTKYSKVSLGNLTLTNYDHDHFSGLPYLRKKSYINTVNFSKNLSSNDLVTIKDDMTDALKELVDIKNSYTETASAYILYKPYKVERYSLTVSELRNANVPITTNHLSQIVFVTCYNRTICISGDLEKESWNLMLKKQSVIDQLKETDIFFASHHGRVNGYHADIFNYCKPECIVISDKEIIHGTQENTANLYNKHVFGNGISFQSGSSSNSRKILTTRSDGHILMNFNKNGSIDYISLPN